MSDETRRIARSILAEKPVFLDTETTGLGPNDQIVELGIVDVDGQVLLSQFWGVADARPGMRREA